MKIRRSLPVLVAAAVLLAAVAVPARAQSQKDATAIAIGEKDIGGVVSSPQGREAGVWVIAETTELPTRFSRIVVTDDQGCYLVPDLPQADYRVWVRGYGLVDSPKMRAKPGQRLDLAAAPAPSEADAAHYYPAIYWYSLLTIPDKKEFGGENGIPANVTQQDWLTIIKEPSLRRLPPTRPGIDPHDPCRLLGPEDQRRCLDEAHPVRPVGAIHGEPPRRPTGGRTVQVFR
jgi:hypothetical protein